MLSEQNWFTKTRDGKLRINSRDIYKSLSNEIVKKLAQNSSVSEILEWIKNETSQAFYDEYLKNLKLVL